jgi:hypothetical protein
VEIGFSRDIGPCRVQRDSVIVRTVLRLGKARNCCEVAGR